MRFEINGASIQAVITVPRQNTLSYSDVSDLKIIPAEQLSVLLDFCVRYAEGKKATTQKIFISNALRPFGKYLNSHVARSSGNFPASFEDWQFLTLQFGLWYISHPDSKAELKTRCLNWQKSVCTWFDYLQEEGWLPLGVIWPDLRLPEETVALSSQDSTRLVGELPHQHLDDELEMGVLNKTIAGPVFWSTEAEFLDDTEAKLRQRDQVLGDALLDYWVKLTRDYRNGQRLLRSLSEEAWMLNEDTEWRITARRRLLTSPLNDDAHVWVLRFMHQQMRYSDDPKCLARSSLCAHPAVSNALFKQSSVTPVGPLLGLTALSPEQYRFLTLRHLFNRFAGIFNNTDLSVAVALLIREHPILNPCSIAGAKLLNTHAKSHFIVTEESGALIFSVDKPRAKSRKYVSLTRKAAQIFAHVLRVTAPVRALLKRAGHPHWRYLFLGDRAQGSLGHPAEIRPELLTGDASKGVTLLSLYPHLDQAGLVKGSVDFSKIRNTKGVLEWFDTGSIRAVAACLGNTEKTVVTHYIPKPLIIAWNERIIRRFQNTIIVLAARDEDWILAAVDMPNIQELHRFLAQIVCDLPKGSSPIADRFHEYFKEMTSNSQKSCDNDYVGSHIQVRLSAGSLALLIAYRQWALKHLTDQAHTEVDHSTGVSPKYFIDLAGMLQAAALHTEMGEKLRECLDIAKLQRCYKHAITLVPDVFRQIRRLSIQSAWET